MTTDVVAVIVIVVLAILAAGVWAFRAERREKAVRAKNAAARAESAASVEAVDACGHKAPAEPVMTDADGDGDAEVVGWLCAEPGCLGRLSQKAAIERNLPDVPDVSGPTPAHISTLRTMLIEQRRVIRQVASRMPTPDSDSAAERPRSGFEVHIADAMIKTALTTTPHGRALLSADTGMPATTYGEYAAAVAEGWRIAEIVKAAENDQQARIDAGIVCDGYREERGPSGSVLRKYAVPGECLCGSCPIPDAPSWP